MNEGKSINLKKDYKIFKYHFPNNSLFPGALFLDLCEAELDLDGFCGFNERAWSANFHVPSFPDDNISLKIKEKNDKKEIVILNGEQIAVKIKIRKKDTELRDKSIQLDSIPNNEFCEPTANHSKEILYLDKWKKISENTEGIKAIGEYVFSDNSIAFLDEISKKHNFGEKFVLIEFMGLTALSSLVKSDLVRLEDNYGFVKIQDFQYNKHLKNGEKLLCVTESKLICSKIIKWSGIVSCNGEIIAKIDEGISISLNQQGG